MLRREKTLGINELLERDKSPEERAAEASTRGETPLAKHVAIFSRDGFFSPTTVAAGLRQIHSTKPGFKGFLIAGFNTAHVGSCPFSSTAFKPDERLGYAKYLHMGTTRIWRADGTINESCWQHFSSFVSQTHKGVVVVPKSKLVEYLDDLFRRDLEEFTTGRHGSWYSPKSLQGTAAKQAWNEVYDRLTCGWIDDTKGDLEPYIHLDLIREFFEDSSIAFSRAASGELPVAKPTIPSILGI